MSATIVQNKEYKNKQKVKDNFISAIIGFFAFVWIFPILWTLWTSLRPYNDIISYGVFSWPRNLNLDNYFQAFRVMGLTKYFLNTLYVMVPSVILILFLGSLIAFVVSRYSFRFNLTLLLFFTAGNMLPTIATYIPVFWLYIKIGDLFGNRSLLYNNYFGIILIHVAFQVGFATFVLSSYMKTVPKLSLIHI